jgi:hypothetical protein
MLSDMLVDQVTRSSRALARQLSPGLGQRLKRQPTHVQSHVLAALLLRTWLSCHLMREPNPLGIRLFEKDLGFVSAMP